MDAMMSKMMKDAQELIPCEHCTVIVIDQETEVCIYHQSLCCVGCNVAWTKFVLLPHRELRALNRCMCNVLATKTQGENLNLP